VRVSVNVHDDASSNSARASVTVISAPDEAALSAFVMLACVAAAAPAPAPSRATTALTLHATSIQPPWLLLASSTTSSHVPTIAGALSTAIGAVNAVGAAVGAVGAAVGEVVGELVGADDPDAIFTRTFPAQKPLLNVVAFDEICFTLRPLLLVYSCAPPLLV
jgi:hypothetical protein